MLVTLTLQKTLEKNIVSKYVKKDLRTNQIIADVLEFSISCKNCGFLLQGRR